MSDHFMQNFQIKSKYTGQWKARMISINFNKEVLGISHQGSHLFKYFSLLSLKLKQQSNNILNMQVSTGRLYEIKGSKTAHLFKILKQHEIYRRIGQEIQFNQIEIPKKINYQNYIKEETPAKNIQTGIQKIKIKQKQKIVVYPRQKSYLRQKDWAVNKQNGGLLLTSEQKKKNQGKIIKFVVKKFVTTGAFMGISFPVFAMKPQTILETYCKSISSAPLIFNQCPNCPVQRIKRFIAFGFSFSRLFSDMDKPFNPTIGQTFQANIGDGFYYAEQTSHHPPQSSIFFEGKGYKIYATLELIAQIGLNSATGYFNGDVKVQFTNGQIVIGRLLSGQMSGFLMGQNKFRPDGSNYVYDYNSKMVGIYKRADKDIFRGHIGFLNENGQAKFNKALLSKDRFSKFQVFNNKDYSKIYSQIETCWTKYISFDRKTFMAFQDPYWLPYQPTFQGIQLLDSDSRYRRDVEMRKQGKIQSSQQQKQKLQQQQRQFKRLRTQNVKKYNHLHKYN